MDLLHLQPEWKPLASRAKHIAARPPAPASLEKGINVEAHKVIFVDSFFGL